MPNRPVFAIAVDELRDADGTLLDEVRLRRVGRALDPAPGPARGGRFEVQDGRLVGLFDAHADPLRVVLVRGLLSDAARGRWAIAVDTAADERPLVERALEALAVARASRDGLVVRTPEPGADRLLDAIAPLLAQLIDELTERQRELARLLIVEGRRQADAADILGVSRATVSVMAARGRVRAIQRLLGAVDALVGAALAASDAEPAGGDAVVGAGRSARRTG